MAKEPTQRELAEKILGGGLLRGEELVEPQPERIDRYQVVAPIGEGATGRVFLARDPEVGREVAIKLLDRRVARNLKRFGQEMTLLGRLDHPGIVTIFDAGTHEGRPYYVMEHAAGKSLAEVTLSLRESVDVLRQVAWACHAAHEQGVVHRDLKPGNVLLGGRAMVADFGIAKAFDTDLTETGQLLGTPQYMAPEQARGQAVDARTDIHAIGVMLYEAMTGRLPFADENLMELFRAIEQRQPTPPRRLDPALPRGLEAVCLRALAKPPEHRYQTAAALAEDLEAWLAGRPVSARPPSRWLTLLRRPPVWGLLALLLAGGLWLLRSPAPVALPAAAAPAPMTPTGGPWQRVERRIYQELLALRVWQANLYRRTEALSYEAPAAALERLTALVATPGLPRRIRQQGLFASGQAQLLMGRTAPALASFSRAIELGGPHSGECHFERARINWEGVLRELLSGDRERAAALTASVGEDLTRALAGQLPDDWTRQFAEVLRLLATRGKEPDVGRQALERLQRLRKVPGKPVEEVAKFTGDLYLISRKSEAAIAQYGWAIQKRYHYLEARNGLALAYLLAQKGLPELQTGLRHAFKAIQINPHYEASYFSFTLLCRSVLAQSVDQINQAMRAMQTSFVDQTVEALRQGVKLLPDSESVRLTYGYALLLKGWQQTAHEQSPLESRQAAVAALEPLERSEDPRTRFGAVLALGMLHLLQASRLKQLGGPLMARARQYLERARRQDPRNPAGYHWLGWQRYLARDYRGALDAWQAACSLAPGMRKQLARAMASAQRQLRGR